jgi:hypothetical protein
MPLLPIPLLGDFIGSAALGALGALVGGTRPKSPEYVLVNLYSRGYLPDEVRPLLRDILERPTEVFDRFRKTPRPRKIGCSRFPAELALRYQLWMWQLDPRLGPDVIRHKAWRTHVRPQLAALGPPEQIEARLAEAAQRLPPIEPILPRFASHERERC